ncbi:oxygen-independent coproporphyrinogen III oxidase [Myroides marinus]|uniref:Coproporphyrinogen-III oxidase n=1 Tax=Myroides marinus TaxID=703342 RepID=A0A161UBD5_9FLAO|nr:oxygen-independent coproporphyrinogen III oxidase [Myroides marinus]KUF42988.1 coproporphyrinogen III oxidase [Myroides marinus]KZE83731.1 coproporphyrinogen III oxidase [Myroides marinus]MDM1347837.1 oxygen-independent coproporphyrinogen III oxidase [Myroides marinus]MDM1351301.1 oxygen-independent coproporphyrinogen III oxidase [Myroides marinus]MDM1355829.1 oxygen-independent coproporphyrinogen III oxidase [Myroides marinus]
MSFSLIQKYNVPGPRYTSYPTVPYWEDTSFSRDKWIDSLKRSFIESNQKEGISIYIHLPFCESLCTFCGCHKRITKRHEVESPYIDALLKEWDLYCALFEEKPVIKEIHLGGGTPTFFSPAHLTKLIEGLKAKAVIADEYEFSFEGHPNNTTKEHLSTLYNLGFRRVSFGVQDYNPEVQKAIHREQSFHNVAKVTLWAKELGYTSISHDIIYGLPFQKLEHVIDTIEKTKSLSPDRLAFYSYAHVPWIKGNGQRGFNDEDVPKDDVKRQLYEKGKELLLKNEYIEIGMDHFSLKSDSLYRAMNTGHIHRNFMGYTSSKTQVMIGLGVSSISDSWYAFAQNEKDIETYYNLLEQGIIPVVKGHILNEEDLIIRKHILNLMCSLETDLEGDLNKIDFNPVLEELKELETDELIQIKDYKIKITKKGRAFVRNVCMALDLRLQKNKPQRQLFSMTI